MINNIFFLPIGKKIFSEGENNEFVLRWEGNIKGKTSGGLEGEMKKFRKLVRLSGKYKEVYTIDKSPLWAVKVPVPQDQRYKGVGNC